MNFTLILILINISLILYTFFLIFYDYKRRRGLGYLLISFQISLVLYNLFKYRVESESLFFLFAISSFIIFLTYIIKLFALFSKKREKGKIFFILRAYKNLINYSYDFFRIVTLGNKFTFDFLDYLFEKVLRKFIKKPYWIIFFFIFLPWLIFIIILTYEFFYKPYWLSFYAFFFCTFVYRLALLIFYSLKKFTFIQLHSVFNYSLKSLKYSGKYLIFARNFNLLWAVFFGQKENVTFQLVYARWQGVISIVSLSSSYLLCHIFSNYRFPLYRKFLNKLNFLIFFFLFFFDFLIGTNFSFLIFDIMIFNFFLILLNTFYLFKSLKGIVAVSLKQSSIILPKILQNIKEQLIIAKCEEKKLNEICYIVFPPKRPETLKEFFEKTEITYIDETKKT